MNDPYRNQEYVDTAELIRACAFDYVGACGDFELDPGMFEIESPALRGRELALVDHPSRGFMMYPEVAESLKVSGYELGSAHALFRWACATDIRIRRGERLSVAALSKVYYMEVPEPSDDCPDYVWKCHYVPVIYYRRDTSFRMKREFCMVRSHSGGFKASPGPDWKYLVYKR